MAPIQPEIDRTMLYDNRIESPIGLRPGQSGAMRHGNALQITETYILIRMYLLEYAQTRSAAVLTLVNAGVCAITIRCVFTRSTRARMLRSPAATRASMRSASAVRYTPAR